MELPDNKKRIAIYYFTGTDGIVDQYIPVMLNALKPYCSELYFAFSGELTEASRSLVEKTADDFFNVKMEEIPIKNIRALISYFGKDRLSDYYEIVFLNDQIMGPVCSFSELFEKMEKSEADVWSITRRDGFLNTDFIVFRKKSISCEELFRENIYDSEKKFTRSLASFGLKCKTYIDSEEWKNYSPDDLFYSPVDMLRRYNCPVFERKSFCSDYYNLMDYSTGNQGRELLAYLKTETEYDVDLIWEHILRTENMADIRSCLNLCYILPKNKTIYPSTNGRIALVMHEHYKDLVEYCYEYAKCFPKEADIIITAGSEEIKSLIEEKYRERKNVTVIFGKNRGRDIRSLLIEANPYLKEYDYVCYVHDKKSSQQEYGITGFSYMDRCFENLIGSRNLVENITGLFISEPKLGLLCVPTPNHSRYYDSLGDEWGPNYSILIDIANKVGIHTQINRNKEPISPLGTMFWFRPEAMKKMLDFGWKYEDFPNEPVDVDGTILHAIERIYTFVAQDAGYFTANILNEDYARTETVNLEFMLRNLNKELLKKYGRATNKKMAKLIRFSGLRRLYPPAKKLMPADMRKRIKNKYMEIKRDKKAEERKY